MSASLYRQLPSVDALLQHPDVAPLPRALAVNAARALLEELRAQIRAGAIEALPELPAALVARVTGQLQPRLRRVVNATGIVLHTNLGRAPYAPEAAAAAAEAAAGYSNVEMQLGTGARGGRLEGVSGPLKALLGCEDAIAVNNNAAAVVLVLTALAQGREVIVSRGELVEIGGSFRVPDIMKVSGAKLVEVGTTNRTRAADFAAAITEQTALLMRVHPSNFRIQGFTERPETAALAALGVPLVEDLGSGALFPGLGDEPVVAEVLADGADLVCFSGDKLLGGPQAGVIAGKAQWVRACRKHPLYRALRLDKVSLASLEATLRLAMQGEAERLPALRMLKMDLPTLDAAARGLAERVKATAPEGVTVGVEDDLGFSGGGALPGEGLPTRVVAIRGPEPGALAQALRAPAALELTPVVARVARDAVLLDPRTLLSGEDEALLATLGAAWGARAPLNG